MQQKFMNIFSLDVIQTQLNFTKKYICLFQELNYLTKIRLNFSQKILFIYFTQTQSYYTRFQR